MKSIFAATLVLGMAFSGISFARNGTSITNAHRAQGVAMRTQHASANGQTHSAAGQARATTNRAAAAARHQ